MSKLISFNVGKKNEDGQKVSIGEFTITGPETLEEAVDMWGKEVVLSNAIQSVVISAQGVARRTAKDEDAEKVQEVLDKYVPGVSAIRSGGPSKAALGNALKEKMAQDPEAVKQMLKDLGVNIPGLT